MLSVINHIKRLTRVSIDCDIMISRARCSVENHAFFSYNLRLKPRPHRRLSPFPATICYSVKTVNSKYSMENGTKQKVLNDLKLRKHISNMMTKTTGSETISKTVYRPMIKPRP